MSKIAIQVRRGLQQDFSPDKLLPGEWAVSVDSDTEKQVIWMCFAAGVTKRMGTYEDFTQQIRDATKDVKEEYIQALNLIKEETESLKESVDNSVVYVSGFENELKNNILPDINDLKDHAASSANDAANSARVSENWAVGYEENNSKYYAEQSKHYKELAEQAANLVIPDFSIDLSTGELVSTKGNGITFFVDADGFLCS